MSDTPRTDAWLKQARITPQDDAEAGYMDGISEGVTFARQLERELAAAQREPAECKAKLDRAVRCIETLLHCPNRCSSGTCGCESQAEGWVIAEGGK